jgi:Family of unknown function (DUF5946)
MSEEEAYHELCGYTLTLGDPAFIHQHVVDAFAAQTANADTKPIKLTFALIGLYLHLEQGFNGREVQRAHMSLAREKRSWPAFTLPEKRGSVTANEVLGRPAGPERERAIDLWCAAVWETFCTADVNTAGVVRGLCEELPRVRRD